MYLGAMYGHIAAMLGTLLRGTAQANINLKAQSLET